MKNKRFIRIAGFISTAVLALMMVIGTAVSVFAYDPDYVIKTYDVDITVNEDNSFDIVETLDVYFDPAAYKHGIIRRIPQTNTVRREDGTSSTNHVTVSGISVNNEYTRSTENGVISLRIGSADEYVSGDVRYVIKYKYDLGRDPLKDKDEFYYNIIGTDWDTSIEKTTFTVRFPKDFDPSTLGFSAGYEGEGGTGGVEYTVNGNTVEGTYLYPLPAYNGLTMRMELPEGYFVWEPSIFERLGNFLLAIPAALLAWVFSMFKRKGSNPKPVEPVEFYPPDGLSPLEIGYIYDGSVDKPDVTSYLIHLANQGYLNLHENGKDYEIELLKPSYDGDDPYAGMFYDGLIARSINGIVEKEDLEDSFYTVVTDIKTSYGTKERRRQIFLPTGKYSVLSFLAGLASIVLSAFMLEYMSSYNTGLSLAVAGGVALTAGFYTPFLVAGFRMLRTRKVMGLAMLGFILFHLTAMVGGASAVFLRRLSGEGEGIRGIFLIGVLCGIICIVFAFVIQKRTDYGNEMLGRIRGFRNFLEQAEKPKLEELVEQDPPYFYNILPYTYVLGVSDKWIKRFDGIAMEPPAWYSGGAMDHTAMMHSIDHSMNSIGNSMMSSPHSSSDSGGGFSGGGFSGGGSGGGGGSSW